MALVPMNGIPPKKNCRISVIFLFFYAIFGYSYNMKQMPGWTYRFIPSLKMQIAINDSTGVMYTEDKIRYSVEEQQLLKNLDYQLPLPVHIVKKLFDGTITSIN